MEEVRGVVVVVGVGGGSILASFSSTCVSVLQCVGNLANLLTFPEANLFGPLAYTPTHNTLQHPATHCNTLLRTAMHCNALQRTATHCNTYCNTLQHTLQLASCRRLKRASTTSVPVNLNKRVYCSIRIIV